MKLNCVRAIAPAGARSKPEDMRGRGTRLARGIGFYPLHGSAEHLAERGKANGYNGAIDFDDAGIVIN